MAWFIAWVILCLLLPYKIDEGMSVAVLILTTVVLIQARKKKGK